MEARHSPDYDMFVPRARQGPPDSSVGADTRQPGQKVANERTSHVALRSPYTIAVFMPYMTKPDFPLASVSPTVDDAYETEMKFSRHTLDAADEGNELDAIRSLEVGHEDTGALYSHAEPVICQPVPNDVDTGIPVVKAQGGEDGALIEADEVHSPKDMELAPRVPDNSRLSNTTDAQSSWPSQEAVSDEGVSEPLRSPESTMTFTLPTSMPIIPLPVHSCLRPSLVLDCRLRWKPPDRGEETRRLAWYVISKMLETSAVPHLPKSSTALAPFPTSPAFPQARRRCLRSLELIWRIHCKPPNAMDTFRRRYTNVVYRQKYTSAGRSPIDWVVFIQPSSKPQLANLVQAINPAVRTPSLFLEFVSSRIRRKKWSLSEAVNGI